MAATPKPQTPALLTTSAATYYTVTSGAVGNVKEVLLTNTTSTDRTVTMYFVPASGSAQASNMVLNAVTVASGGTLILSYNTFLDGSGVVQALASAGSAISIRVSAIEYS